MVHAIWRWVKRWPILAFYLLAFGITWLGWVPQAAYSHGLFPYDSPLFYILGGVGPLVAAFIVLRVLCGEEVYQELFGRLAQWRVGVLWYVIALFGYCGLWIAALALKGDLRSDLGAGKISLTLLPALAVALLAAIPEEVAWRGFVLPRLQARYNALIASLIIGVLWGLWHLPLLVTRGNVMASYPLFPYLLKVLAAAIIYTWLFNSTGGSVLIVTIFHAASNALAGPFVGIEQSIIFCLVAAAIVMAFGPTRLSRTATEQPTGGTTTPIQPTPV